MAKSEASSYIQPIYKQRATKYLVQLSGGKKEVERLGKEQLHKMRVARDKIALDMQFNALKWFRPFPYQKKFFKTGKNYTRRGMIAANRSLSLLSTSFLAFWHLGIHHML